MSSGEPRGGPTDLPGGWGDPPGTERFERWEAWVLLASVLVLMPAGFVLFAFSAVSHTEVRYSPLIGWVVAVVGIAGGRLAIARANRRQGLPLYDKSSISDLEDVLHAARRVHAPVALAVVVGLVGAGLVAWAFYDTWNTAMLP